MPRHMLRINRARLLFCTTATPSLKKTPLQGVHHLARKTAEAGANPHTSDWRIRAVGLQDLREAVSDQCWSVKKALRPLTPYHQTVYGSAYTQTNQVHGPARRWPS